MTNAFDSIMTGMKQAIHHAEGHTLGSVHKVRIPDHDVREIRIKTGLSQSQFAASIGVSTASLQNWEQGKRKPKGAAKVLLALLHHDPKIVQKLLA
jgi:putative transcriptional regulator